MSIPENWIKQVEEYQDSGVSQAEWCDLKGIAKGTFQYRLKKVREGQRSEKFIEVKMKKTSLKLCWKSLFIELDPEFDQKTLQRFLCTINQMS